ncbi:hypothetical protein [Sporomusa sp.]|jgi:hypothetical protein|uniref:hypothetical protein n=1 Tax=Sporomusa sp. TaxID=2078658 RepID=UPI0029733A7F|nr:hypothetical protein [Sporomusa sp.]MDF2573017.1 hypothetical protein [Sporomusa sp.]MDF2874772.1 hypothetical protein [Sporomusa sp.]HWR09037.1 hypothetical protein [Sporomusa sp.]
MSDHYQEHVVQYEQSNPVKGKDINEIIIIIRDGQVITFLQKNKNAVFEGRHGDGI